MKAEIGIFLSIIRVKQWIKSMFVFAPLLFSLKLLDPHCLFYSTLAFISFCQASSFVYIVNDILDRKRDRMHPVKKNRPIASGKISVRLSFIISLFFAAGAIILGIQINLASTLTLLAYMVMNIIYSAFLKHIVILDVMIIAFGFVMRVILGTLAIGSSFSNWILLTTFFLSLFLGFGKRRQEIDYHHNSSEQLPVLEMYNILLLDYFIIISVTITILTYSLYVINADTLGKFGTNHLIYTLPFVVYGLFRYLYLIVKKHILGDPSEVLLHEKGLIIDVLLWIVVIVIILYL